MLGESVVELLAELQADKAGGRRVDGQLGEQVEQVDLALAAPLGDHLLDFALDRRRMAPHVLAPQRLVVEHLIASLGAASKTTPSPKIGVMNG